MQNKITSITPWKLWLMTGVGSVVIIKIINDPEFLAELAELVKKYNQKRKSKK